MNVEGLNYWCAGTACGNERWEAAYARFETPAQERRKFLKRFRWMGLDQLPRDLRVVNLFCGRGQELVALHELGFTKLAGVDLSPDLLSATPDYAERFVGDCTDLRFEDASVDMFLVQGGLHHLQTLPEDLELCLDGVQRCLRSGGRFCVVEPWDTPFLRLVHAVALRTPARRVAPRIDALASMIDEEWETYHQWLSQPDLIHELFRGRFEFVRESRRLGKWMSVLRKT